MGLNNIEMNNTSGNNIAFLEGGGEMGKLIRQKDWDKTSLGAAQFWPQSLRTALDILLNSQFPMFLFWGKGLVFFYNDAFRSGLGREGKRPSVPGMEGKDAWPEMWPTIKPLIDRVLINAEAVRSEDQLIPTNRNGAIEDACWTFSYSPVKDETGKPTGVFVTCTETTDKVLAYKKVEENKSAFEFALEATELGTWNYDPISGRFSSNERLKSWFGLSPNQEVELSYAINAMLKSDRERVSEAIRKALEFSSGGNYDIEYTIVHPITKKEILVHAKGKTWFNEQKIAYRFNGTLEDITEKAMATKKIRESEERYHHLIYSSPSAIGILYGEDLVITIANDAIIKIWGKGKEIMG
ncbi:MAG: sensor signal transduction histidine kinase [Bacteroidota bacterium]|nr:sensor signal transduction histidine kinase [Bacteroidota bacterium]